MKLGEMLIRDGRLTRDQLGQAIAQQARDGGRLGTVMVEMKLIDLDALTIYLGLELGIPIATGATLDRAKRLAVRLLSPEQALRYRCVPLLIQDRQLIAAVDDPHDMESLDDLTRVTGYRVIPRVAPEIRIFYYLERYYGVPRPARFRIFGDSPRGSARPNPAAADLPGPPLPGLPPISAERVPVPHPAPPLRATPPPSEEAVEAEVAMRRTQTMELEEGDYEFLELQADGLLEELEADDAATAKKVEPSSKVTVAGPEKGARAEETIYEAMDLEDAIAAMGAATQRTEIADALLSYATPIFDVAALCIVRDNMAFGWRGYGPDIDQDRIEALLVPLDAPSIFRSAVSDDDGCCSGAPFPSTLHNYLFKVLRCPAPPTAAVYTIAIGKRVVNLLYTHHAGDEKISEMDRDGLRQACAAASAAYVRLIAVSKKGRAKSPALEPEPAKEKREPRRVVLGVPDEPAPEPAASEAEASPGIKIVPGRRKKTAEDERKMVTIKPSKKAKPEPEPEPKPEPEPSKSSTAAKKKPKPKPKRKKAKKAKKKHKGKKH